VKVLFIGLGGIGQRHLRILKKLYPDSEIAAVRSRGRTFEIGDNLMPDNNVDLVEKYNIHTFTSISEAKEFSPDFAIVANPTSMHISTAEELVKNKIPVLIEKPVSNTTEGLENLLALSHENETPVMIGYMMRFHPCAIQLKSYIDDNALGNIYSAIVTVNSYMPSWHQYEGYNKFYAGQKKLGGGVVLTEIHEIDLLHWLFGAPDKIYAVGGKLSNLDLDVEDTVSVLMEQKINDRLFPVNINMSFVQKAPIRKMLILGEYGSLDWDISNNILRLDDYENNIHKEHNFPEFERNDMFSDQMKNFIGSLQNGVIPLSALENVIGGHMTALSIRKAIQSDDLVEVKSDF
jgi:predicted dehydrogenase